MSGLYLLDYRIQLHDSAHLNYFTIARTDHTHQSGKVNQVVQTMRSARLPSSNTGLHDSILNATSK